MSTELQSLRRPRLFRVQSGSVSILTLTNSPEDALERFFSQLKPGDELGLGLLVHISDGARRWITSVRFELIRRERVFR